jgi:hypothetical protein
MPHMWSLPTSLQSSSKNAVCFGVPLEEYFASRPHLAVPVIVQKSVDEVERRGLDVQGIYRMAGQKGVIDVCTRRFICGFKPH